MTERDEYLTWVVRSVLRDAEMAVHNGDAGRRRAIWSGHDPVPVLGARRNASGQQQIDDLFAHLADSFSDCIATGAHRQSKWQKPPVGQPLAQTGAGSLISAGAGEA